MRNRSRERGEIGRATEWSARFNRSMTRALLVVAVAAAVLAASATPAAAPVAHIASVALDGSDVRVLSGSEPATSPVVAPRRPHPPLPRPPDAVRPLGDERRRQRRPRRLPYSEVRADRLVAHRRCVRDDRWDTSPCRYDSRNCAIAEILRARRGPGEVRARLRSRFRARTPTRGRRTGAGSPLSASSTRISARTPSRSRTRTAPAVRVLVPQPLSPTGSRRSRGRRAATGSPTCSAAGSGSFVPAAGSRSA